MSRLSNPLPNIEMDREESDPAGNLDDTPAFRVLTISTIDITLSKLLRGIIGALRDDGFVSEAACADGIHAEGLRNEGYTVHSISFQRRVFTWNHLRAFIELLRLFRRNRYDIVHVHTPFAQVLGRTAAKMMGVPVILYTSHGFQFHESRPRWARALILAIERVLGQVTDVLFTQSHEDAATAVELGIAARGRVVWIGNGVSTEIFTPRPVDPTVRNEFQLNSNHVVLAFVGRIVREKGVLDLVEAMVKVARSCPRARLLMIGDTLESDGDVEAKQLLQVAIEKYGIGHLFRFAGLRDDVPRLLRAVDLLVLPSWREGMPRSIIEGMATGLPVVATDIRGCREEVVHEVTGLLVPPKDPEALAAGILKILSNPERAREMGRRGRMRAIDLFDEREVIRRQLKVYRRIVDEGRLKSPFKRIEY